jgi:hypothetical protein
MESKEPDLQLGDHVSFISIHLHVPSINDKSAYLSGDSRRLFENLFSKLFPLIFFHIPVLLGEDPAADDELSGVLGGFNDDDAEKENDVDRVSLCACGGSRVRCSGSATMSSCSSCSTSSDSELVPTSFPTLSSTSISNTLSGGTVLDETLPCECVDDGDPCWV